MRKVVVPLALGLLGGCSPGSPMLQDARFPTGSSTMAATADHDGVLQVNVDEGSVSALSASGRMVTDVLDLGPFTEPTRIARLSDTFWVTLRGTGEIAILGYDDGVLSEVGARIPVGTEPVGIVADESGEDVYVAVSQDDKVVHIDALSRAVVHETPVGDDPRWLALHPSDASLYVGHARGSLLQRMPLTRSGSPEGVPEQVPLPETRGSARDVNIARITGDMAIDPFGDFLLVPTLQVYNSEQLPTDQNYYATPWRFTSTVTRFPLRSTSGKPRAEKGFSTPDHVRVKREVIHLMGYVDDNDRHSFPSAVTVSPDGQTYAVSMEGADLVLLVGSEDFTHGVAHQRGQSLYQAFSFDIGLSIRPSVAMPLPRGSGPRGLVWLGDETLWAHEWQNVSATPLPVSDAWPVLAERQAHGVNDGFHLPVDADTRVEALPREDTVFLASEAAHLQNGRFLFNSASSLEGGLIDGISCATCHFEGRDDGITWQLGPDPRQTPSLAGVVSATHPVTWTDAVESVAEEAQLTSMVRMGLTAPLPKSDYLDVQAYIDTTRSVITAASALEDPRIAEGEAIFNREDVGCATCHDPGRAFTDGELHPMYGLAAVNTPTLAGIAATPPYLHDGRAETLAEVLQMSRTGEMGDTSMLDDHELQALEAYLRTL